MSDERKVEMLVEHIQARIGAEEGLDPVSSDLLKLVLLGAPVFALRDAEGHPMVPTGWKCDRCGAREGEPVETATEKAVWAASYGACFGAMVERFGEETDGREFAPTAAQVADAAVAALRDFRAETTPEQTCEMCGCRPGYNHDCPACARVVEADDGDD